MIVAIFAKCRCGKCLHAEAYDDEVEAVKLEWLDKHQGEGHALLVMSGKIVSRM